MANLVSWRAGALEICAILLVAGRAAYPIKGPNGHNPGTPCAGDRGARTLMFVK